MSTVTAIKQLVKQISDLVEDMVNSSIMLRGSFGTIYRRCGKATCWCAQSEKKGHPCTRVTWADKGAFKTRSIPQEDAVWVQNAVDRYHDFRRLRRELRECEQRLEDLLTVHERTSTTSTKSQREYLIE